MRDDVKSLIKGALQAAMDWRYHRIHCIQANKILRSLERIRGRTDPKHIESADAYARDVLGGSHYAPWLYVYTSLAGMFKEGWIPDNYYGFVVVPRINGSYGKTSSQKALTSTIFSSKTFPDIGYFANGLFFTVDKVSIPERDMENLLFSCDEKIVFKTDSSQQGKGVFFFNKAQFDIEKIKTLGNGVFQKPIIQHRLFDDFSPNSVATIRITTAVDDDGVVSARACYLRFGRSEDTHIQSRSHIRVPVDISSGAFFSEGYSTDWLAVEEHPDTKIRFSGCKIPAFSKCASTVLELHKKIPFARCVGWDLAIDRDENVRIMEWNAGHNDIKFSEATQGPCFSDMGWDRLSR